MVGGIQSVKEICVKVPSHWGLSCDTMLISLAEDGNLPLTTLEYYFPGARLLTYKDASDTSLHSDNSSMIAAVSAWAGLASICITIVGVFIGMFVVAKDNFTELKQDNEQFKNDNAKLKEDNENIKNKLEEIEKKV
uniref:Col_cuticle_N domain-containing protein n=1 Tax=Meloidogyne hapla TaxID=6305 RepID=A0A1I8BPL9_MELHA